jgi:nucleoside-diphosphate-sugar epimerase
MKKIVVFGGNGFVGTRVCEKLIAQGCDVTCVSRSGTMPEQLVGSAWANKVDWQRGDASKPDVSLLQQCDVLISVIGAPPIPSVTKKGYARSVFTNGTTNATVIDAAGDAGILRVVLLGAKIPSFLRASWFGYAEGKRIALQAAQRFSTLSNQHAASVVQPGGIFGKRHTQSGREIPIDWIMKPLSKLMPSQLISVDRVAQCISEIAVGKRAQENSFAVIEHGQI